MSGIEVLKDKCIGCSLCSKICPQGAIEMKDNKAEIGDACNLCGTCVAKCPVKAIVKAGATLDNLSEWDVSHLKDCRDVWVVTELRDGQIAGCTYELLGEARRLTVGTEHKVAAVLLCEEAGDYPGQLIAGGADIVYLMQDQVFHRFLDQPYKEAIVSLVKEEKPLALLLSATAMGRSLAPRLAANLRTGLTADCTKLELRDNGLLIQTRPTVDDANIVVAAGAGMATEQGIAMVQELAEVLGGAMGVSRKVVDAGLVSYEHQVGQTGKTVGPQLYIACGISGAVQHVVGMSSSRTIIAINLDPDAQIFHVADIGVVADAYEFLPKLIEALKARKAEK